MINPDTLHDRITTRGSNDYYSGCDVLLTETDLEAGYCTNCGKSLEKESVED